MILEAAGVDSQLTVICKLDRASGERARTRAEDIGARGDATGVVASLQVRDERLFILLVVW